MWAITINTGERSKAQAYIAVGGSEAGDIHHPLPGRVFEISSGDGTKAHTLISRLS
jgi:hypothetical protein